MRNYIRIMAACGFLGVWVNAFIFRSGYLPKIGTLLLLGALGVVFLNIWTLSLRRHALFGWIILVFAVITFRYPVRDLFIMLAMGCGFIYSRDFNRGCFDALLIFLVLGSVTIVLSFMGIGHSPIWSIGTRFFMPRFSFGFVTAYHLAAFAIVLFVACWLSDNSYIRTLASIFLVVAIVCASSRVIMVAIVTSLIGMHIKRGRLKWFSVGTAILLHLVLVYWMALDDAYGYLFSSRDVITKAVITIYQQSWANNDYMTFLLGVFNNHHLASLVPSWQTSVPLDGMGLKAFASGFVGVVLSLGLVVWIAKLVVESRDQLAFGMLVCILTVGLGADMFNTWHMLVPLLMLYLYHLRSIQFKRGHLFGKTPGDYIA